MAEDLRALGAALRKAAVEAAHVAGREAAQADLTRILDIFAKAKGEQAAEIAGLNATVRTLGEAVAAVSKSVEGLDLAGLQAAYAEHRAADARAMGERTDILTAVARVQKTETVLTSIGETLSGALASAAEMVASFEDRVERLATEAAQVTVAERIGKAETEVPAAREGVRFEVFRGAYQEGKYFRGDAVVHKGSTWLASEDTEQRPVAAKGNAWLLMAGGIGK